MPPPPHDQVRLVPIKLETLHAEHDAWTHFGLLLDKALYADATRFVAESTEAPREVAVPKSPEAKEDEEFMEGMEFIEDIEEDTKVIEGTQDTQVIKKAAKEADLDVRRMCRSAGFQRAFLRLRELVDSELERTGKEIRELNP